MFDRKTVRDIDVSGKKVMVRVDYNVPLDQELSVTDDTRIRLSLPTIEYLKKNKVKRLVICGMQTHMCLEAAVRAAHDYDFECIVVHDACAARDLKFADRVIKAEDVHYSTLSTLKAYAKIIDTATYLKNPSK